MDFYWINLALELYNRGLVVVIMIRNFINLLLVVTKHRSLNWLVFGVAFHSAVVGLGLLRLLEIIPIRVVRMHRLAIVTGRSLWSVRMASHMAFVVVEFV